jgi:TatA/E family protein of Tat protein translocase
MPFGLQPLHLVVIVIVALIIFGPSRLPEIGRGLGKALNEFRAGTREMTEGFRDEVTRGNAETPSALTGQPPMGTGQPAQPAMPAAPGAAQPAQPAMPAAPGAAQPATGNFCPQCGTANPADARFCKACGSKLTD